MRNVLLLLMVTLLFTGCDVESTKNKNLSYNKLKDSYHESLSGSFVPISPLKFYHAANTELKYIDKISEKRKKFALGNIINNYKEAIKLDPTFSPAYYGLGLAYIKEKKNKEAIQALESALAHNPECVQYKITLADICMKEKQYECAIYNYKDSLLIEPENIDALLGLAELELEQNHYRQVVELYEKVLKIDPKNALAAAGVKKFSSKVQKVDNESTRPCHQKPHKN